MTLSSQSQWLSEWGVVKRRITSPQTTPMQQVSRRPALLCFQTTFAALPTSVGLFFQAVEIKTKHSVGNGMGHCYWTLAQLIFVQILLECKTHFTIYSSFFNIACAFTGGEDLGRSSVSSHMEHPNLGKQGIQIPQGKAKDPPPAITPCHPSPTTTLRLRLGQAVLRKAAHNWAQVERVFTQVGSAGGAGTGPLFSIYQARRADVCDCVLSSGWPQRPPGGQRGQRSQYLHLDYQGTSRGSDGLLGFFKAISTSLYGQPPGGSSCFVF